MGGKKYIVELSDEDRKTLEWFTSTVNGEPKTTHAHVSF